MKPAADSLSIHLAILHRQGTQFMAQRLGPWGLGTGLHPYVLALAEGPCLQVELSRRLMVDKANTARAVAKLEGLGLVSRVTPAGDQRAWLVALSPKGRDIVPRIQSVMDEWDSLLRTALGPEASDRLASCLGTLTAALRQLPVPEAPASED